jgi:hypothetical protein
MRMTLREDRDVTGAEAHRRLGVNFHKTLTFGDEVEDDNTLGVWLQQPGC